MLNKVILTSCVLILSFLSFVWLLEKNISASLNIATSQLITINKGETVNKLSSELISSGWLESKFWLKVFVRFNPEFSSLKAGTYQIKQNSNIRELLQLLTSGKEHQFKVTFIEGTTLKEWLLVLKSHAQISHTISSGSNLSDTNVSNSIEQIRQTLVMGDENPEGWFFPDTYAFTAKTKDTEILARAHNKMKHELTRLWKNREQPLPYKSAYEALIMASIVEKESAQESEKPLIASVFVNRLNKKMRLQTDPTVIYGLGERYNGDITRAHLREKTAYNTYRINRLPPTPIAMPGLAALEAVLAPATTDYLYFVSQGNGPMYFHPI